MDLVSCCIGPCLPRALGGRPCCLLQDICFRCQCTWQCIRTYHVFQTSFSMVLLAHDVIIHFITRLLLQSNLFTHWGKGLDAARCVCHSESWGMLRRFSKSLPSGSFLLWRAQTRRQMRRQFCQGVMRAGRPRRVRDGG